MQPKIYSISTFFPCYNDKGTIASVVLEMKSTLEKLTDNYEIIVVDDGSTDGSCDLLLKLQHDEPQLKLVFHEKNQGYGGALRGGFRAATKELVFYTDGDGQYDVKELPILLEKLTDDIDIVNGYKLKRQDPLLRIIIGYIYQYTIKFLFRLKIRDVDCDFRLIRRRVFDYIKLESNTGTICVELIKKIEFAGFKLAEVGVSHFYRTYGKSQFFTFKRIVKTLYNLSILWFDLFISKKGRLSK
ncbi:MAG: glycosyltransferase family 2 protein [bacterium]|nr:glycosyltransferase family 2 protein [bacterium]